MFAEEVMDAAAAAWLRRSRVLLIDLAVPFTETVGGLAILKNNVCGCCIV